jgi:hypothetical protein
VGRNNRIDFLSLKIRTNVRLSKVIYGRRPIAMVNPPLGAQQRRLRRRKGGMAARNVPY